MSTGFSRAGRWGSGIVEAGGIGYNRRVTRGPERNPQGRPAENSPPDAETTRRAHRTRRTRVALACLLAVTVFVAFAPSLRNGFVNSDDNVYITENPAIRALSWQNLRAIFGSSFTGVYVPLTVLSYAMEYQVFGLDPTGYHADNLILHVANCLLVFWLMLLLGSGTWVALAAAAFFGLHPLRVESVAWATERKDVLFAFFYLLSLIAYLRSSRYRRQHSSKRGRAWYWLSLVAFTLSVFSKPMAVTLPLVLVLVDFLVRRKITRRTLAEKAPFLAIAVAFILIEYVVGGSLKTAVSGAPTGFLHKITTAGFVLVFYVSKMIAPVRLAVVYPYTDQVKGMLPAWFGWAPWFVAAAGGVVAWSLRRTRKVLFGSLFAVLAVTPVMQFVLVPGDALVADRHTYIMAIGIAYLAAEGLAWVGRGRGLRRGSVTLAVAAAAVLAALTWQRCGVWKNSLTLWTDVIGKYPVSAPVVYYNRAAEYTERKEYGKAIADLTEAVRINPGYGDAYNDLGIAHARTGNLGAALAAFDRALALDPTYADAFYNRAMVHVQRQDFRAAAEDLNRAISLDPASLGAYQFRALAYYRLGQYAKARQDVETLRKAGFPVDRDLTDALDALDKAPATPAVPAPQPAR
jgi:tetratricopeptide (TPR) repeat protein